jgi:hypothetical protein
MRRADYIILAACVPQGTGAVDIADPPTRVFMTLLGPRHLKFSRNIYISCGDEYNCLEIFAFLPRKPRAEEPK